MKILEKTLSISFVIHAFPATKCVGWATRFTSRPRICLRLPPSRSSATTRKTSLKKSPDRRKSNQIESYKWLNLQFVVAWDVSEKWRRQRLQQAIAAEECKERRRANWWKCLHQSARRQLSLAGKDFDCHLFDEVFYERLNFKIWTFEWVMFCKEKWRLLEDNL